MKTINKIKYIVIFFLMVLSCQKDIEYIEVFDFDFKVSIDKDIFRYELEPMDIRIIPEVEVSTVKYNFSYRILEGDGYLEKIKVDKEGTLIIDPGAKQTSVNLEFGYKYYPTSIGTHSIEITISDLKKNYEHTKIIGLEVTYSPFSMAHVSNASKYPINAKSLTTMTIVRKEDDVFDVKYTVAEGIGVLFNGENEMEVGESYKINHGVSKLYYLPSTLGKHIIKTNVVAPDGAVREQELEINVRNVDFSIDATSETSSVNINESLPIILDLSTTDENSNVTYEITSSYATGSNNGVLTNDKNELLTPGVYKKIIPKSYSYKFKSTPLGNTKIYFHIKDSNGQIKKDSIDINVDNVPFQFLGNPTENDVYINDKTQLNFSLTPEGDTSGIEYFLNFEQLNGTGVIVNKQGEQIDVSIPFKITPGEFTYKYVPKTLGSHKIKAQILDNYNLGKIVYLDLESTHVPFTFNMSSINEEFVNQSITLDFSLTSLLPSFVSYEMNYVLSGGQGKMKHEGNEIKTGEFNNVETGSWTNTFIPENPGSYKLIFQIRDSNLQIIEYEYVILVKELNFQLTAAFLPNAVKVGNSSKLVITTTPTATIDSNEFNWQYEIISGSGSVENIQTTTQTILELGTQEFVFVPEGNEDVVVKITVSDSFGNIHTIEKTLQIQERIASLEVNVLDDTINLGQTTSVVVTVGLEEGLFGEMYFEDSLVGEIKVDGKSYLESEKFSVINKSYTITYEGLESGKHRLKFVLEASNLQIIEKEVDVTIAEALFENTVNIIPQEIFVDEFSDMNVNISQNTGGDTNYKMSVQFTEGSTEIYAGGTLLTPGSFYDVTTGNFTWKLKGITAQTIKGNVIIKNSTKTNEPIPFTLIVKETNFDFMPTFVNNSIQVNTNVGINIGFAKKGTEQGITYAMTFTNADGDGTFTYKEKTYTKGQNIPLAIEDITSGSINAIYTPSSRGTNQTINLTITASNGISHSKSTVLNVTDLTASISSNISDATINAGESTSVFVTVQMDQGMTGTLSFEDSATGTIEVNGTVYNESDPIDVTSMSYNITYTSNEADTHNLTFILTTSNGLVIETTETITVAAANFTTSVNVVPQDIYISEFSDMNVNISQNTGDDTNYKMSVQFTEGSTEIYAGGTLLTPGSFYDVTTGNFTWKLKGITAQTIKGNVIIKNSTKTNEPIPFTLIVKETNFDFTPTFVKNSIQVNTSVGMNIGFAKKGTEQGITYAMTFTNTDGDGIFRYKENTYTKGQNIPLSIEDITSGSINAIYTPSSRGTNQTINLTITASNGISHSKSTVLNVTDLTASISSNVSDATINAGESTSVFVTVQMDQGMTGTFSFEDSATGTIEVNGTVYNESDPIDVTSMSYNITYTSNEAAIHNLTFILTTSNGLVIETTETITVAAANFTTSVNVVPQDIYISEFSDMNVNISQNTGDDTNYKMSVQFTEGSTEIYAGGTLLTPGAFYDVTTGNFTWKLKGITTGTIKGNVIIKNSTKTNEPIPFTLIVQETDFDFTPTFVKNSIDINQATIVNISFVRKGVETSLTYQMKITNPDGDGDFTYNETKYAKGALLDLLTSDINNGFITGTYSAISSGDSQNISFEIIASNGITHSKTIPLNVKKVAFTFNANSANSSKYVGESSSLNYSITSSSTANYTLQYEILSGSGVVFNSNGEEINSAYFYTIPQGNDYLSFKHTVPGTTSELIIIITSPNGTKQEKVITFATLNSSVSLTAGSAASTSFINESVVQNFTMTQSGSEPLTYIMVYQTNGTANVIYNSTSYTAGQAIPIKASDISSGTWSFSYMGTTSGNHAISWTLTASNGNSSNNNTNINYTELGFTLTGSFSPTIIYKRETSTLGFNISQVGTPGSYSTSFAINGGNVTVKDGSGTTLSPSNYYSTSVGNNNWTVTGDLSGSINITLTTKNSTGATETITKALVIKNTDFTFTAGSAASTAYVNESVAQNFSFTKLGSEAMTYSMVYTTTGTGSYIYNGASYTAGQSIPIKASDISSGTWSGIYSGSTTEKHTLAWVLKASDSVEHNDSTSIDYMELGFTLTGSFSPTIIYKGETSTLGFNISQVGTPGSYSTSFAINGGNVTVKDGSGTTLSPSNYYSTSVGNNNWTVTGDLSGSINITLTTENSTGATETITKTLVIKNTDFTFTAGSAASTAYVNENVAQNFSFTKLGSEAMAYSMVYTTTGTGSYMYNGASYTAGQSIPIKASDISSGTWSGIYLGLTSGKHTLTWVLKASNNVEHNDSTNINYTELGFTLTGSFSPTVIYIGATSTLGFNITQSGGSPSSYSTSFSISGGNVTVKDGSGTTLSPSNYYSTSVGNNNWTVTGDLSGSIKITLTTKNSTGATETISKTLIIEKTDFNFSATSTSINAEINSETPINFLLTKLGTEPLNYSMSFSSTVNGKIKYNGTEYSAGQQFIVTPGNFSANFIGTSTGTAKINFVVNAGNNISHNDNVSILIKNSDYTLRLISETSSVSIKDSASYNFEITSAQTGNVSVKIIQNGNNLNSSLKVNASVASFNVGTSVSNTFTIYLTPNEIGSTSFTVETTKNGIIHTKIINLISTIPTFTLVNSYLTNTSIWNDEANSLHTEISTTYSQGIEYTYKYGIQGGSLKTSTKIGSNGLINDLNIDNGGSIGNLKAVLTVTNTYGYSKSIVLSFTSKNVLPQLNSVNFSIGNEIKINPTPGNAWPPNDDEYGGYDGFNLLLNPSLGKYPITNVEVSIITEGFMKKHFNNYCNPIFSYSPYGVDTTISYTYNSLLQIRDNYITKETYSLDLSAYCQSKEWTTPRTPRTPSD